MRKERQVRSPECIGRCAASESRNNGVPFAREREARSKTGRGKAVDNRRWRKLRACGVTTARVCSIRSRMYACVYARTRAPRAHTHRRARVNWKWIEDAHQVELSQVRMRSWYIPRGKANATWTFYTRAFSLNYRFFFFFFFINLLPFKMLYRANECL